MPKIPTITIKDTGSQTVLAARSEAIACYLCPTTYTGPIVEWRGFRSHAPNGHTGYFWGRCPKHAANAGAAACRARRGRDSASPGRQARALPPDPCLPTPPGEKGPPI